MKSVIALLVMVLLVGVVEAAPNSESTKVFYRYKNSQGVTVMDSSIPPEYVNGGYEILSIGGKVLKVVPPALDAKEAEQQRQARLAREERARADLELRRSYSNVKDIDAAKARNLQSLKGNIDILDVNLSNAHSKLQETRAAAASLERTGRTVSDDILKNIANLEQEEKNIQEQIKLRQQEYQQVSDKFDADRQRFIEITKEPNS